MSDPFISVIIPTYHRNQLLAECLERLAPGKQTLSADQYEVIVGDDGSTTTAETMIQQQYPWATWVAGPRKGAPGANRNRAAQTARGIWLVFTDDDCLPEQDWLSGFSQAFAESVVALEGAIHPRGDLERDMAECPVNLQGGCFWSANIAVRHDTFLEIGGFDEGYPYTYEDVDLYWRLQKISEVPFVPEAKVVHPVRVIKLKNALQRIPKMCASWAYHTKKYPEQLGYHNHLAAALGCLQNARGMVYALKHGYIQASILRFAYLLMGAPFTYYYRISRE